MIPISATCEAPCISGEDGCTKCLFFETPTEKLHHVFYSDSLWMACGMQLIIDFIDEMIENEA